jgi:hypothetical protein
MNSSYANLINQKQTLSWEALQLLAYNFSNEELERDEEYWQDIQREKRLELQSGKPNKLVRR